MALQTDRMRDVVELFVADLVQVLPLGLELLVDLDRLFGHLLVRFLAAAHEGEIRAGRHALVAVGIQTDAEKQSLPFFLFGRVRHGGRLVVNPKTARLQCFTGRRETLEQAR